MKFANAPTARLRRGPLAALANADTPRTVGRTGLQLFRSNSFSTDALVGLLRSQPDVEYAEPNYILRAVATPDDPEFPNLWGLLNIGQLIGSSFGIVDADIDATDAWDISTGNRSNVVAIIDTGIDYTHPDLAANIWSAPAPFSVVTGGGPLDCPAGSHGFNAILNTCDPMDDNNHGTHVAGTIGAVGNNALGVAGVNWTASMIGGKFLNAGGSGSTADAIEVIEFMIQAKAAFAATGGANIRILSNSWGGGGFSGALQTAIINANAADMLFTAAAGNAGTNNDVFPFYPAGYDVDNVIAVASTDNRDQKSGFSNFGATTVHLGAPGTAIRSTIRGGGYAFFNGTSMATPHVSGVAALVLSHCTMDTPTLKAAILDNVDPLASLVGITITGGRLNAHKAIQDCGAPGIPAPPTGLSAAPGDAQVSLSWNASAGATSYAVYRSTIGGGPYVQVSPDLPGTSFVNMGLVNGTPYFYVVTAENATGQSGISAEVSATPAAVTPADYVVSAVANPPASAPRTQTFPLSSTTRNQGSAPALVKSNTRFYLSLDAVKSAADILMGNSASIPALAAGASKTKTAKPKVKASTALGSYFVIACADDLNVIAEGAAGETNNCRSSTTKVTITP